MQYLFLMVIMLMKRMVGMIVIILMALSNTVLAMGSPSEVIVDNTVALDSDIMLLCKADQIYSASKGTQSSHYCSHNGRYLTKGNWVSDTVMLTGEAAKELTAGNDYTTVRDSMSAKNYRLPTLKELLNFINFDVYYSNGKSTDPFAELPVVGNWFQNESYSPSNDITKYVDGYLISSTYKQDNTVMAVDIRSRALVALDILTTFAKPAYVLGVRDYFQMIELSSNLCLGFDVSVYSGTHGVAGFEFHTGAPGNESEDTRTADNMIRAVSCIVDDPSQRWYLNADKLYLQNRNENEYCLKADTASLSSTPADCTSFDGMSDKGLTHLKSISGNYLDKNSENTQLTFEAQETEPDRRWFIQY